MTPKKPKDEDYAALAGFTVLSWMLMTTGAWIMWGAGAGVFTLGVAIFIICCFDDAKK